MQFRVGDLPVFIGLAAFLGFFVFLIIQSWKPENKEDADKQIPKK